jgi:hypothetical protein
MRSPFLRARRSCHAAAVVQLLGLLASGLAGAEPSDDEKALATALFQEGRALMADGRPAEACPKLEESQRLDPSGGTMLNLALCYEQEGALARSWTAFHEAMAFARRNGRSDRERAAEEHIRALEPRLSKLTIVVPEGARVDGLRIEQDGQELARAAWSIATPVDGGEHVVRATAPGKEPFATTVVMAKESDVRTVEIPPLADLPGATAAPAADAVLPVVPPPRAASSVASAPAASSEDGPRAGATQRTIAWAIGAAGVVQLGLAGYFGLRAFDKHADSNAACPEGHCTTAGVELNEQSQHAADASTVLAITGLATVATSVYLLVTAPKNSGATSSARTLPTLAITGTGSTIGLRHRF